jgi:DNA-3-methyladenine glycosylase
LGEDFFARDTARVARDLIGARLVRVVGNSALEGKVVETEAYYGEGDPPSHASSGRTARSEIMWRKPGLAYVYLIYGMYFMFNVVTESRGSPGAVLIRAVEPLEGLDSMEKNRGGISGKDLTNGPGKLAQAFKIDRGLNGEDVVNSEQIWFLARGNPNPNNIETSRRIGVSEGKEEELRFYLAGNEYVSRRTD